MNHGFFLHTATTLIQHFGYFGLGLGLVISTLGLFSSEVFLLLAGVAWRQGSMEVALILIVALVGQLVGGLASYSIGRYGGVPLIERYGRSVLLSPRDLQRAHRWFGRYGRSATVLGYCLPFIRGYIGYAAGIAQEPRTMFVGGLLVGSLAWSIFAVSLGYYLAANLDAIERVIQPISYFLALAVAAVAAVFIWRRWQERVA